MALVVETGVGVQLANTYITRAEFDSYAELMNWNVSAYADEQIEAAIVRATRAIDHWETWQGVRTYGQEQGLFWPRKAGTIQYGVYVSDPYMLTVIDSEGLPIAVDYIPSELKQAVCEAAYRELLAPQSMQPDNAQRIKMLKAGSVAIEYETGASVNTNYTVIDDLLSSLVPDGADNSGNNSAMVELYRA
jgi:hypothetical protein